MTGSGEGPRRELTAHLPQGLGLCEVRRTRPEWQWPTGVGGGGMGHE